MTVLHELTDLLTVFGFRIFTPRFLAELRKEQPKVVNEAKRDHDLARIPSTRQYLTRMQKRIRRKKLEKGTILDWKQDAGEYAQRMFPYHGLAIRLIVLAQLTSCSVFC